MLEYAYQDLISKWASGVPKWAARKDAEDFLLQNGCMLFWCKAAEIDAENARAKALEIIVDRQERESKFTMGFVDRRRKVKS